MASRMRQPSPTSLSREQYLGLYTWGYGACFQSHVAARKYASGHSGTYLGYPMLARSLATVLFLALAFASQGAGLPLTAAEQVAQMKRGVNIVGYDPLWQDATKARFQPRHFKIIKDGGFDTVRINLYGF